MAARWTFLRCGFSGVFVASPSMLSIILGADSHTGFIVEDNL